MADSFDAVEIIQSILGTAVSGASVYKERSTRDDLEAHIVIRSTGTTNLEVVNIAQVNVNIYVPMWANGTVNRQKLKTIRSYIVNLIENAADPAGYYCVIDMAFSALLEDAKEGFDCFTIRYELTLNN
jgi:hypothetical protein